MGRTVTGGAVGSAPGRRRAWVPACVLASVLCGAGVIVPSAPAAAYPSAAVTLVGHGYGHGHGMGQWGALGYALAGTGYQTILTHYYGGSSIAALPAGQESTAVRVALTENDGNTVIVTAGVPFSVPGVSGATGVRGVLMSPDGAGGWNVQVGPGCAGPWSGLVATGAVDPVAVPAVDPGLGDPNAASEALQLCQLGPSIAVRGSIEAVYNSAGAPRTVDVVPLEDYVSGVVPNESPAGWGTLGGPGPQGQPWGFQELEAQAVAVRSYVMAGPGSYGGYADICDGTACQSYRGMLDESPLTDAAVAATAGQVMELPGGAVAATQYSASTGGYTSPGTFPAVPDDGDQVCVPGACNPNHTWTASVPVSAIEVAWPQLGTLLSVTVTGRNGYGDLGGRVTTMTLVGSSQSVSLTGEAFAAAVGLRSDWFAPTNAMTASTVSMSAAPSGSGYWLTGRDGGVRAFGTASFLGSSYGLALVRPVVGMAGTPDGRGYWLVASDGGIFSFGDAAFYGSTGAIRLNQPVVGMSGTPDGHGYWLVASDGGIFSFGDAAFYGSTGAIRLNQPVVGMAGTPDGRGYWLVASDGGIFTFGDAPFLGSAAG